MSEAINLFEKFLKDSEAADFYITGVAGTGKTTSLHEFLTYCLDNKIEALATAYTHKAVQVLRSKLPSGANLATLHSFLKKRPTVNTAAKKVDEVDGNSQAGIPDKVKVLFIDEFSMIGERDYRDIATLQYNDDGDVTLKVVYIGDPNQLPPVRDQESITPGGEYWVKLTQIYRQAEDNPLIDTLICLNAYIHGAEPEPLKEHTNLKRNTNIVELYQNDKANKIMLAYTNKQVQALNAEIEGKTITDIGDKLFSPTIREHSKLVEKLGKDTNAIVMINGTVLLLDSKFKTLETLQELDIEFYLLEDNAGREFPRAVVFGHENYLEYQKKLALDAVEVNKKIERKFKQDAKKWATENWRHELAIERKEAWKKYMSFKDCVICVDFNHALTVHKSQGSTYENVYLDIKDMGRCAETDYTMYLRLLYVAISRASGKVFTN